MRHARAVREAQSDPGSGRYARRLSARGRSAADGAGDAPPRHSHRSGRRRAGARSVAGKTRRHTRRAFSTARHAHQHGTRSARKKWKVRTFDAHGIAYPRTEKGNPSFTAGNTGWMDKHAHWLPQLIVKAEQVRRRRQRNFSKAYILGHIENGRIHAEIHPHRSDDGGTRSLRFSLFKSAAAANAVARRGAGAADPRRVPAGRRRAMGQDRRLTAGISLHRALRRRAGSTKGGWRRPSATAPTPTRIFTTWLPNGPGSNGRSAKGVNFAKAFGAGVRKFAEMIGKPEDEAHAIYDRYDRELPFVKQLSKRCQSTAAKQGYLELYDGARRHWDTWEAPDIAWTKSTGPCSHEEAERRVRDPNHPWYRRSIRRAETHKAMNALIQGSSRTAHQTLDAGLLARRHRPALADARRARLLGVLARAGASWSRSSDARP